MYQNVLVVFFIVTYILYLILPCTAQVLRWNKLFSPVGNLIQTFYMLQALKKIKNKKISW